MLSLLSYFLNKTCRRPDLHHDSETSHCELLECEVSRFSILNHHIHKVHTCVCVRACVRAWVRACVLVCVCLCARACVRMHVFMEMIKWVGEMRYLFWNDPINYLNHWSAPFILIWIFQAMCINFFYSFEPSNQYINLCVWMFGSKKVK